MEQNIAVGKQGWLGTARRDTWWVEPLLILVGLSAFGIYSTYSAVFWDYHFEIGPYLSPFYEPLLVFDWWPFSPAILILWIPLGFRTTCYYYRGAYWRSFFANPPACAVTGWEGKNYAGEAKFPIFVLNFHRYFMYAALLLNVMLWVGAVRSYWWQGELGIGLGSIILTINAFLLMMYSLGCHSLRHLVGGKLDCFSCSSCARTRKRIWDYITRWNEHHKFWAWVSLIWVAFTDFYVRMVSSGVFNDPNTWSNFPRP
ncbi:MAG: succinate dehydrogenase [Acidobacteria bacterium]|nr:succinate dehydrogenase [Acidobacteriota bacterium]